jgi:hypothetical protein
MLRQVLERSLVIGSKHYANPLVLVILQLKQFPVTSAVKLAHLPTKPKDHSAQNVLSTCWKLQHTQYSISQKNDGIGSDRQIVLYSNSDYYPV